MLEMNKMSMDFTCTSHMKLAYSNKEKKYNECDAEVIPIVVSPWYSMFKKSVQDIKPYIYKMQSLYKKISGLISKLNEERDIKFGNSHDQLIEKQTDEL